MTFAWYCPKCNKKHPILPAIRPIPPGVDPDGPTNRCPNCNGMMEPIKSVNYKGFEIQPMTRQRGGTGKWTADLIIERHSNDSVKRKPISGRNTYHSKEEAVEGCIETAKKIIDGQIKGCTVDDL